MIRFSFVEKEIKYQYEVRDGKFYHRSGDKFDNINTLPISTQDAIVRNALMNYLKYPDSRKAKFINPKWIYRQVSKRVAI